MYRESNEVGKKIQNREKAFTLYQSQEIPDSQTYPFLFDRAQELLSQFANDFKAAKGICDDVSFPPKMDIFIPVVNNPETYDYDLSDDDENSDIDGDENEEVHQLCNVGTDII